MNPFTLLPKNVRTWVYAIGLLVMLLLDGLGKGFDAIKVDEPRALVFAAAFWAFVVGPAGLALALAQMKGTSDSPPIEPADPQRFAQQLAEGLAAANIGHTVRLDGDRLEVAIQRGRKVDRPHQVTVRDGLHTCTVCGATSDGQAPPMPCPGPPTGEQPVT